MIWTVILFLVMTGQGKCKTYRAPDGCNYITDCGKGMVETTAMWCGAVSYLQPEPSKPEPDVPAVKEPRKGGYICRESDYELHAAQECQDDPIWTCADKSRILLTAEDGSKHCLKF